MQKAKIETCEALPARDELDHILSQYYALIVQRMRAMGLDIDPAAPASALAEFWESPEDYLPRTDVWSLLDLKPARSSGAEC